MVYVDDAKNCFGRMLMSHMVADTSAELYVMAEMIGLRYQWIQFPGTCREHFDVSQTKRDAAVARGAQLVTQREIAQIRRAKCVAERLLKGPTDALP